MNTNNVYALTFATENNIALQNWISTAENNNYKYTILGLGNKWKGWKDRALQYFKFLKTQPKERIFIVCDSYDLYFVQNSNLILEKYLEFKNDIVVGAEKQCCSGKAFFNTQIRKVAKKRAPKGEMYIYPNAGFIMGKSGKLAQLYKQIYDCESKLVVNFDWFKKYKIKEEWTFINGKIKKNSSGNFPSVYHFPGTIEEVYNYVGENVFKNKKNINFKKLKIRPFYKTTKFKIISYIFSILLFIILVIFVVKKFI